MDIWDRKKRSDVMSRIKDKNTRIEVLVRRWLHAYGYRFRNNDKRYPGTPDIVLPRYRTAIFVHGCFWHHHSCKLGYTPKTRVEFWQTKFSENARRDQKKTEELTALGWKVIILWECELKWNPEERLIALLGEIRGEDYTPESLDAGD